jgi:hypothetical protein
MRWRPIQLLVFAVVLLVPARAAAELPGRQVLQFQLPASNGYVLQVKTQGSLAHVSVWRRSREFATIYDVGDSVNGSEIDADLGSLGRIQVQFHPSGALRTVRVGNSDCRLPRQPGTFTGAISFRGENGYASAEAVSAPGMAGPSPRGGCGGATISSGAPPTLQRRAVERVWAVNDATLMNRSPFSPATQSSTLLLVSTEGGVAHCLAYQVEMSGPRLSIFRRAGVTSARSIFAYTHTLRTATIAPPAPFSGEATYSARRHRLSGDLAVQFPGLPPESLTGPTFEARIDPYR